MRPSGVVSHDLPVRVAPWTITTGTLPSPPCGTMNRTYIWLTVMWPPGTEVAQLRLRLLDLLAADVEAALGLQHQRRVRRLHVLEGLRLQAAGGRERARQREPDETQ